MMAVETREAVRQAGAKQFQVRRVGVFLGAEITGIDLTKPLDTDTVMASVARTGRLLCVGEAFPWGGVTARKMFGGAGLYRDGKMFGLITGDVAYLKVDDTNRQEFVEAGSEPFKPYAEEGPSMSYYEIPPEVLEDRVELVTWAQRSLEIQKRRK